jgi:hypothetical protein
LKTIKKKFYFSQLHRGCKLRNECAKRKGYSLPREFSYNHNHLPPLPFHPQLLRDKNSPHSEKLIPQGWDQAPLLLRPGDLDQFV